MIFGNVFEIVVGCGEVVVGDFVGLCLGDVCYNVGVVGIGIGLG